MTPPVGVNLYVAASMTNLDAGVIAKKALPMIGVLIIALLVITYVEGLTMVLV